MASISPAPVPEPGRRQVAVARQAPNARDAATDWVAVEEPLELRIRGQACVTLMRTPGDDRRLALGHLFTDGWIDQPAQVGALALCAQGTVDRADNIVDLIPAAGAQIRAPTGRERHGVAVSSCGVCGKRTIAEVLALSPIGDASLRPPPSDSAILVDRQTILSLPARLRASQRLFASTGSLHAAGIFDAAGKLLALAEDVGRHNAVDKVIGWAFESNELPLDRHLLFVSGRVSFEIVQKAFRGGLALVGAVSGVSSLAVDLAEQAGITLLGFVRGDSFGVYAHGRRVRP